MVKILKGKGALVTGASGGIGGAIASLLECEECHVYTPSVRHEVKWHINDQVDILVNCAAVYDTKELELCTGDDFETFVHANIKVPYFLTRYFIHQMKKRGWGRVVNIGSTASHKGFANNSLYCMSKHALLGLSRALYEEYKGTGVRVLHVSPCPAQTNMAKKIPTSDKDWDTYIDPKEFAEYVVYLLKMDNNMVAPETEVQRYYG